MVLFMLGRLLDVVHGDKKLFLVFEYLDRDLKKYMDSVPAGGISLSLVKVILTCIILRLFHHIVSTIFH